MLAFCCIDSATNLLRVTHVDFHITYFYHDVLGQIWIIFFQYFYSVILCNKYERDVWSVNNVHSTLLWISRLWYIWSLVCTKKKSTLSDVVAWTCFRQCKRRCCVSRVILVSYIIGFIKSEPFYNCVFCEIRRGRKITRPSPLYPRTITRILCITTRR